ncbi:MAG: hypothetical protein AB7V18_03290 [Pyrinomonadaceae bacterium]
MPTSLTSPDLRDGALHLKLAETVSISRRRTNKKERTRVENVSSK